MAGTESELQEIAGLLAALPNLEPEAKMMATDAVLGRLKSVSAPLAQIVGTLLAAQPHILSGEVSDKSSAQRAPRIENVFGAYRGEPLLTDSTEPVVDCLIITVKEVELEAVLAAFGKSAGEPDDRVAGGRALRFARHSGVRYGISAVGVDGNTESAIAFGRLFEVLRPSSAVLIGMAGGVEGEVGIGDVVVTEHVYAYDFRRVSVEGDIPRFKTSTVSPPLIREAEFHGLNDREWASNVVEELRQVIDSGLYDTKGGRKPRIGWKPKVKRGGILAGGQLIEDGSLPGFAKSLHDRVKAAEMEGAGFAAAASEVDIPWLVLRGIADHGNPKRRKGWQFGATFVAAAYLRDAVSAGSLRLGVGDPRGQSTLS